MLLHFCMPGIEHLEERRLLSVSASTLAGPVTTVGDSWSTELLSGATVLETNTQTVVGRVTNPFGGPNAVETDETGMGPGAHTTTTSKLYGDLTSAGLVAYGSTAVTTMGSTVEDLTTTYSPTEVLLPPSMVAGTSYTENTTQTTNITGASPGMTVTQITTVLNLEPAQQSVTVPAGTYSSCYVVDETLTTTQTTTVGGSPPTTTGPITNMGQEFFAPNVGLVKFAVGMGATVLTNFTTGGGGGGGGGTGLTPAIVSSTVPPAVVAGAKLHGLLKINLTDSLSTAEKGFTVNVYAAPSPTLDTSVDTLVTTATRPTIVNAGKTTTLLLPVTSLPSSLTDGTYYLIVQTSDSAGNTASVASTSTVVVAAPFVSLSETLTSTLAPALVSGSTVHGTVTLTITNNGNVTSHGATPIEVTLSTVSGTPGTSIASVSKNLSIPPGKSTRVVVPVTSIPALPDNNYFIVDQATDPFDSATSVGSSTGTIAVAAPFIRLSATLGSVANAKLGDSLTITNNGNIADVGKFNLNFGFSLDAAGLMAVGGTASQTTGALHVNPGKSAVMHVNGWKSILSSLTLGVPYYLTVLVTDASGNTALAVSPTSVTG